MHFNITKNAKQSSTNAVLLTTKNLKFATRISEYKSFDKYLIISNNISTEI